MYAMGLLPTTASLSVIMKVWCGFCLGCVLWYLVGFGLVFGEDVGGFVGAPGDLAVYRHAGWDAPVAGAPAVPGLVLATHYMILSACAPLLLVGAAAERMPFRGFLALVALWLLGVFYPVAHWTWAEGGVLDKLGEFDPAGGTVVHVAAGASSMALTVSLPKRPAFRHREPHNVPVAALGVGLMWLGALGLHGGAAAAMAGSPAAAVAGTVVAPAVSSLAWMAASWRTRGAPSLVDSLQGAVGGVAVAAGCAGAVETHTVALAAALGGLLSHFLAGWLRDRLGVDDGLRFTAVHLVSGAVGSVAMGISARETAATAGATPSADDDDTVEGLLYGDNGFQTAYQFISFVTVATYASIATGVIAWQLKKHDVLTVPDMEQTPNRLQHDEAPYVIQLYKGRPQPVVAAMREREADPEELRPPTIPGPTASLVAPHSLPATSSSSGATTKPPGPAYEPEEKAQPADDLGIPYNKVAPAPPVESPSRNVAGPPAATEMRQGRWDA